MNHSHLRILRAVSHLAFALGVALPIGSAQAGSEDKASLAILPPSISLEGPEASQRLMLVRINELGEVLGEVGADEAELVSSDPAIAEIKDGVVYPGKDGEIVLGI